VVALRDAIDANASWRDDLDREQQSGDVGPLRDHIAIGKHAHRNDEDVGLSDVALAKLHIGRRRQRDPEVFALDVIVDDAPDLGHGHLMDDAGRRRHE
jgi:hypothetical protein